MQRVFPTLFVALVVQRLLPVEYLQETDFHLSSIQQSVMQRSRNVGEFHNSSARLTQQGAE
jgi:hypothetical protein